MRLAAALAILCSPAHGQQACADRERIVKSLSEEPYLEQFAGGGMVSESQILELWYSRATGSWTILATFADGRACVMASGRNWRRFEQEPPGEDG